MYHEVIVAGAGPSGMMAAIYAARGGADVLILERNDKPLKKLYATGNGRCNFTNLVFDDNSYRGGDPAFVKSMLGLYGRDELMDFFHGLGMMTRNIGDYVYPYNEQARTVADALLLEARRLGCRIVCGEMVVDITSNNGGYTVVTNGHRYECRAVVAATGGKASPVHGSDGNLNKVLEGLGNELVPQYPALVPLGHKDKKLAKLAGVRVKCSVWLTTDGVKAASERGEIIFNKDNVSGIPVMQLSRYATKALNEGREAVLHIDLFPDNGQDEIRTALEASFKGSSIRGSRGRTADIRKDRSMIEALSLMLNEKLALYCLDRLKMIPGSLAVNAQDKKLDALSGLLLDLEVRIDSDAGFERAQVTAGGFGLSSLDEELGSRSCPGLYIVGELCDVDGTCGGYNLQWAFTSGAIAGKDAADHIRS
ncbi:MAG: aminoacetone oxidase family FAD-binding enzyme [Lachnospiraceae bacterium]|nr:aminoacetone oxidase family FAD-binding enzyme [Lachnospiraceae bacterium]